MTDVLYAPAVAALPDLAYDHFDDPDAAHRAIRAAREIAPIAMGPYGPEILTYELARAVLRDDRFVVPPGFGLPAQGVTSGPMWDRAVTSLLCLDGAAHHRLRRLVAKAFTPKAAARMRSACADVINKLLDDCIPTGRCDAVADICLPYPIPIICALLGAPPEDWQLFSAWADDVLRLFARDSAEHQDAILRSWAQLDDYVDGMVAARRRALTDDLLSDLIRAEVDGDRLDHDELLMLAGGLLMAGTDTTRNQLAAALEDLGNHPEQWRLLSDHPELAPRAVEELMRHRPIIFATLRVAREDVELAGHRFPADTLFVVNTAAANHDPAVFADPERLDITREGAPAMLTFGGGIHYCLGVHLARLELAEALTAITGRLAPPRLRSHNPWKPLSGIAGPQRLPLDIVRTAP